MFTSQAAVSGASQCRRELDMKSLLLERPISSRVEPRGTDHKCLSAGKDRTFQFDAWIELIVSTVPSTRLQLDSSR